MPYRNNPEKLASANERKNLARPVKWEEQPAYREEGRKIAAAIDEAEGDFLLQRACEKRGRSVAAVRAERDRVLRRGAQ